MIEYIYFVKCPNCEDEHFDFFDEAKEYAMSCLSKNPIITQVEVCRNDFGECTDSTDLGTIWSSDYVIADTEKETTDGSGILTKDFLNSVDVENDPEFAALDNSVEPEEPVAEPVAEPAGEPSETSEISALDEIPDNFKKPLLESRFGVYFKTQAEWDEFKKLCDEIGIYTMGDVESFMRQEGATPDNLLAKLREYRAELGPDFKIKESRKPVPDGLTIEQLVEEMEENEDMVECTWCNDLFPKDECRKEVDLGYLCSRCEAAIKSRGEKLTFVENDYWDFLDENMDRDPLDHHDPDYDEDEAADYLGSLMDAAKDAMYDKALDELAADHNFFNEDFDDPVDEEAEESIFDGAESVEEVAEVLIKEEEKAIDQYEEAKEKIAEIVEGEDADVVNELLDHIKEEEEEHIEELEGLLPEESENETSEISVEEDFNRLGICPECGEERVFDHESGVCNNCGFMIR